MKSSMLISFLLVGALVMVSASDVEKTAKPSKFPKKFDSKIHSLKSKPEEKEEKSPYTNYEPVLVDEMNVPTFDGDFELPSLYLEPPPEFLYTNPEGEVMEVMMAPSDLDQEPQEPYVGYGFYEPDPEGMPLEVPQPWSYAEDPSASSIAYILSEDTKDAPQIELLPPSDRNNEQQEEPSSYLSL